MEIVVSSIGEELKKALNDMANFLKNKVFPKFIEAFKWISEKINKFKLTLLEQMFDFVSEVTKLAKGKDWDVEEIHVQMPEIGVKFTQITGIPISIPIPDITPPRVSVKFTPTSVVPKPR